MSVAGYFAMISMNKLNVVWPLEATRTYSPALPPSGLGIDSHDMAGGWVTPSIARRASSEFRFKARASPLGKQQCRDIHAWLSKLWYF